MIDNRPKMSITDFIEAARTIYEPNRVPVILWGPTGIGKTDVMIKLSELTDRILRIFYPAGMEPPDLSGLPMQSLKNVELIEFKKTDIINFEPGKKYLVFMDELNRATLDMQQALVALYNSKPYFGVHSLETSDLWIVTAMNDTALQQGVNVSETDDALRTRAAQIILKTTTKEVGDYLGTKYQNNFMANFLRSPHIAGAVEPDFANVYKEAAYIMATPRNFEMGAKVVQGKSVEQIRDMFSTIQSILGIAVVGAIEKYISNMKRFDPELLFRNDGRTRQELDVYLNAAGTDQDMLKTLLDAFNQGLSMSDERPDEQVASFLRNLIYINTKPDGTPGYRDVIGGVFANVRLQNKRNVAKVAARREFLEFFKEFHENPGESKK